MIQLDSLIQNPTDNLGKIVDTLRKLHHEFLGSTRQEKEEQMKKLFSMASKEDDSDKQWSRIRFYIYSHIIVLQPNPKIIPQISLLTRHGALFKTLTILYLYCRKRDEGNEVFKHAFVRSLNEYLEKPTGFYSRNTLNYTQNLPKLLLTSVPNEYLQIFNYFFRFLRPKILSDSVMSLFKDIFGIVRQKKASISLDLIHTILEIFKAGNNYPYSALYYFFDTWYLFFYKKMIPQTDVQDQLDFLSNMIEQSLINAENEFLHFFQWEICFKLFQEMPTEKTRIKFLFLLLISLKIRLYQPFDQNVIMKLDELSKHFILSLRDLYTKKISLLPTFTCQLITTFKIHIQSLKQIKYLSTPSPIADESQTKQIFNFSELYLNKKTNDQITSQIIISLEILHSDDKENIKKWFDIFEKIYRCSIIGSIFYTELMHCYFDLVKSDTNNSILIFYINQLIHTWIKFMVELSYRATHLQRFTMSDREKNGITEKCIKLERRLTDVSNIQSKMQNIIRDIPPSCYQICSDTIITILSKSVKKHVISPFFLQSFEKFINQSNNFRHFLTQRMHQYFFEKLSLLTSTDKNDVIFLEQWLLLMIKLKSNDLFLESLMLDSQYHAISAITTKGSQIIYQQEAVNIMVIYSQFVIENISPKQLSSDRQMNINKSRRIQLDDLHPSVRIAASTAFINESLFDISKFYLGLMQLLMFSLKSKDDKTRSKAVFLILKLNEHDSVLEQFPQLIHTFFSSLKSETNEDTAKLIFKEIPKFSQNFTAYSNLKHFSDLHSFGKNNIPTFEFLCAIEQHMNFDNFEFFNLFNLLNYIFHNSSFDNISNECFLKYLSFLGSLHQNESIRAKVDHLFTEIQKYYLEKDPTFYFLCLVSISNTSRSSCSDYIIEKLHEFTSLASIESLSNVADKLYSFVPFTNNFFLIVVGISTLISKSPDLITFNHIQPIIKSNDSKIYQYYNSILKLYLANASQEKKQEFVNFSYHNLSDVLPIYRPILIKRMHKTGLMIDIDKIEYSIDPDFFVCYQTAACILCGNINSLPNSNDFYKTIFHSLRGSEESQKNYLYYVRGITFIHAVFKAKSIPFLSNQEFMKLFFNFAFGFIKNTIFKSGIPINFKMAKKTIKMIFDVGKNDKRFQAQLDQVVSWPEKEKNNILLPKKVMNLHYYRSISKFLYGKASNHANIIFIECVQSYSDLNELQQIQSILSFKIISKAISQIQDKTILLPSIAQLLNSFGKLLQSHTLPFRYIIGKYFKKTVSLLKTEVVSILCSLNRDIKNADTILEFLSEDESIQKQILFEIARNDLSRIHPQAFLIMLKIFKESNDPILSEIINLQNLFNLILRKFEERLKNINDEYIILESIVESLYIETLRIPSFKGVQLCAQIFSHPEFLKSKLYYKFKKLMNHLPKDFVTGFLNYVLSIDKTDPFIHGLLLKLSIKSLLPIEQGLNEILWNFLLSKLEDPNYLLPIFNCMYILIKNDNIVKTLLKKLIKNLFNALTNQNNQLNLIGLKLTCKLIEKELLSNKIHQKIIEHLLTFPKFLDSIYRPYSSLIFSTVKKPYSDSLNDALTLFVTDNLISYKDMVKIIFISQNFPNIESNLPFEILPTFIEILQTLMQQNTNSSQVEFYLMYILKAIPYLQVTDDSMRVFLKLCYEFLYKALKKIDNIKNFPTQFFQFILQKDSLCTPFPDELVKEIDSYPSSNFMFGFVCFILKFAPYQTIHSYYDSIRKKIDINSELVFYYSKYFISAALKNQEMPNKFLQYVEKIIENSKSNQESLILNTISSSPNTIRYALLHKFYLNNLIKPDLCSTLIEQLDYIHQEKFITEIFKNQNVRSFCQQIYKLFTSTEISNSVKKFVLDQLIKREEINDIKVTIKIISLMFDLLKNQTDENESLIIPDSEVYIIRLSVVISYLVDQKSRLLLFDICRQILEVLTDEKDEEVLRFNVLLNLLKNKLWNDKCLPFIILLINGEKIQPLIAFSNRLSSCAQVARFTFERILLNEKCPNLLNFYLKCLKNGNKQVIKDLTLAFQNCKIRLPDELNWKASKYSIFCDFDLSTYSNPRILYPNTFSDYRFGSILPSITKDEMILTVNFLLTNYVDDFCNFSIHNSNSNFDEIDEQGTNFSLPLMESIYNESCGLFRTINENSIDYSYFFKHDKFNGIQQVNLIESMTMSSFQIRNNLTRFELERIMTIDAIVQLQNNGGYLLKLDELSHNVNSYFASIIKKCSIKVNGKIDKQECQINANNNSYQYFVLSPLFASLFKRVSGYTKHGFLLATLNDIDFSLSSYHLFNSSSSNQMAQMAVKPEPMISVPLPTPISAPQSQAAISSGPLAAASSAANEIMPNQTKVVNINQNCSSAFNRFKWANFMFNMFFNTPSAVLANSTITNLLGCIDDAYLSKLHKYESATRIITVLRICSNVDKLMVVVVDCAKKMSKNATNCMRIWTSQLLHIAKNEMFRHMKKPIFYDTLSLITRFSIDSIESLQREILQFDLMAQRTFPVLIEFHNFLYYLFNSEQIEYSNNDDRILRINSILPLNLPSLTYRMGSTSILRIHGDSIRRISENMIVFSASTYSAQSMQFIVEKVNRPNEAVSLINGLFILNMALKNSYASSSRTINFTSHFGFEIGHEFVLYDAPINLKLVTDFECFVSSEFESNCEVGESFSPLCTLYSSSPFPESFFARRQSFIKSMACNQFLRNLFCLPQTQNYMFSCENFKVPINVGEFHVPPIDEGLFDQFVFEIPVKAKSNSPRFSIENSFELINGREEEDEKDDDKLRKILGPSLEGEVMMTVAAVSKSLTENIECLRGVLEVLAFDGVQMPNYESIHGVVGGFQERLLKYAPPDPLHALYPNYQEWIDNLLCFVGMEERKHVDNTVEEDEINNAEFGFNPPPSSVPHLNIEPNVNMQINSFESNLISGDNVSGNIDLNQFNDPYLDNDSVLNGNHNKFDDFDSSISQDHPFDDDPFF